METQRGGVLTKNGKNGKISEYIDIRGEAIMKLVKPKTLPGFMELEPKSQIMFDKIKRIMEEVFRSYGFYPIDSPVLERTEILLAKGGGETEKQVYRFNKGDTDITMRYDLTVPLAKYVAMNYSKLAFPFKRYQIGKVYRGEKSQKGRFREFYQCDIDIIGSNRLSVLNEAEIPSVMCEVFNSIGLHEFVIRINNRKFLNGLFELYDIAEHKTEALRIIDKLEKIGEKDVIDLLVEQGINESIAEEILSLLSYTATNDDVIDEISKLCGKNVLYDRGVDELKSVIGYMRAFGANEDNYKIDLSIARGLDYYTGTVYETTFLPKPEIGSICSGGRYDELASYFTKESLPGVGMSIGLTRLFYILNEFGYINDFCEHVADVLILPMTEDLSKAIEISTMIRKHGIITQIYLEDKKFKHKISYADKIGVPFVIFIGDEEIENNMFTLKDMQSGEQTKSNFNEVISILKENIKLRSADIIKIS